MMSINGRGEQMIQHHAEIVNGYGLTVTEYPERAKELRFQTAIEGDGAHGMFGGSMDSRTLQAAMNKLRPYRKLAQTGSF